MATPLAHGPAAGPRPPTTIELPRVIETGRMTAAVLRQAVIVVAIAVLAALVVVSPGLVAVARMGPFPQWPWCRATRA